MIPMDTDPTSTDAREILRRTLLFARRALSFWYAPFLTLAAGALVLVGLHFYLKPAYRSEVVILATDGVRPVDASEPSATAPRSVAARMQEIVTARSQLGRAVDEFNLYPEIRHALGPVDAVDELRKHVQFRPLGGDTFKISFEGSSPPEAQMVTSRLADLVIEEDSRLRRAQARMTQDFFVAEKKRTESQLNTAEQELASFLAEHPRFANDTMPLATGAAVRASQGGTPSGVGPSWGSAAAPRAAIPLDMGQAASSSPIDRARASSEKAAAEAALAAARANLAEKLTHLMPAHPDVKSAQGAVQTAEVQLATLGEAVEAPLPSGLEAVPLAAAPKTPAVARYAPRAAPAPPSGRAGDDLVALETSWDRLTRALIEARQRHSQVEVALFKANIAASSEDGTRMAVIDPAYLPLRPVPPGPTMIAAIVLAIALALGLATAIACAAFDDRIYTEREVDGIGYVLVEVPKIRAQRRAHVAR